jgi:hypothetical protein
MAEAADAAHPLSQYHTQLKCEARALLLLLLLLQFLPITLSSLLQYRINFEIMNLLLHLVGLLGWTVGPS